MTIVEAIKEVLSLNTKGLTSRSVYNKIIELQLYNFGAKNPVQVVNSKIRRHCIDLDFPSAHPVKYFKVVKSDKNKLYYALIDSVVDEKQINGNISINQIEVEMLPEERISTAYSSHLNNIHTQLLDTILKKHPVFFEHLVVNLLLKMGYGYDKSSGIVTDPSHDGGIDGIIYEDKLGLDTIYIQAKRYDEKNKVGVKDLQAFVGAMQNVSKGVFITTSQFTKDAKNYIEKQQQKSIKLIDGQVLTEYLIKYEIGILIVNEFKVYKIDNDFFQE